jgi:hypothetical protein
MERHPERSGAEKERFNEQYPDLMNKGYFTDVDDDTMRLGTFYYAGGIYYILRQWLTEQINKTPQEGAFAYSKAPFLHTLLFQL